MPDDLPTARFDPLPPELQPRVPIKGYANTIRRNPLRPPFRRPHDAVMYPSCPG